MMDDDCDEPTYDSTKIRVAVARLIWKEEITLGEFYEAIGVDFGHADGDATSEISGILTGWSNPLDPLAEG